MRKEKESERERPVHGVVQWIFKDSWQRQHRKKMPTQNFYCFLSLSFFFFPSILFLPRSFLQETQTEWNLLTGSGLVSSASATVVRVRDPRPYMDAPTEIQCVLDTIQNKSWINWKRLQNKPRSVLCGVDKCIWTGLASWAGLHTFVCLFVKLEMMREMANLGSGSA